MLSPDNLEQISHVARLAVLAMCARGVGAVEFENSDEVKRMVITVSAPAALLEMPAVDIEYYGTSPFPIGGMAL